MECCCLRTKNVFCVPQSDLSQVVEMEAPQAWHATLLVFAFRE